MYRVVVSNQCSCFKKSQMQSNQNFLTRSEAISVSEHMVKIMNETFCKKHEFVIDEMYNNYIISIYDETKKECCGNGCCM